MESDDTHAAIARPYWERVAGTKRFGHPVPLAALEDLVARDALVLDCGCGYGRVVGELTAAGWTRVAGLDFAAGMLARARREAPTARLVHGALTALPIAPARVDALLAFAVLTCVPDDAALDRILAEWCRVVRPGGHLGISDCALGDDARNRERYERHAARGLPYGTFDLPEGARFRHFDPVAFERRLVGFDVVWRRALMVTTMNGHAQPAFQLIARRA